MLAFKNSVSLANSEHLKLSSLSIYIDMLIVFCVLMRVGAENLMDD